MVKTYIYKNHKEWNLVQRPMGKKDTVGNKIPGITHHFMTNSMGMAEFRTDNPDTQKFLENQGEFKKGQLIIYSDKEVIIPVEEEKPSPNEETAPKRGRPFGTTKDK